VRQHWSEQGRHKATITTSFFDLEGSQRIVRIVDSGFFSSSDDAILLHAGAQHSI